MKKIATGIDDFSEIIESGCYYVDKTLFIKEIIDDGAKVILIPRRGRNNQRYSNAHRRRHY